MRLDELKREIDEAARAAKAALSEIAWRTFRNAAEATWRGDDTQTWVVVRVWLWSLYGDTRLSVDTHGPFYSETDAFQTAQCLSGRTFVLGPARLGDLRRSGREEQE